MIYVHPFDTRSILSTNNCKHSVSSMVIIRDPSKTFLNNQGSFSGCSSSTTSSFVCRVNSKPNNRWSKCVDSTIVVTTKNCNWSMSSSNTIIPTTLFTGIRNHHSCTRWWTKPFEVKISISCRHFDSSSVISRKVSLENIRRCSHPVRQTWPCTEVEH